MKYIREIGKYLVGIGLIGSLSFKNPETAELYFWAMMIGVALVAIWGLWWLKNRYFAR